jgi:type II secretory pathway pseudopilin PulG
MNFFPQPCEFPRVSGHPFHHGMTNQNGQGQVLGGQAPSESARLGAEQGHAKAATNNNSPSLTSSQNQTSNIKNQKSFPIRPASAPRTPVGALRPLRAKARPGNAGREQSVLQSLTTNLPFRPLRPLRPLREQSAFSLTEVVIAMGVAAVAFTSIIALFPLGLNMNKESYEATQAALIAQTIMADLKDQQTGARNLRTTNPQSARLFQISPNSDPMSVKTNYAEISIDTGTPRTAYIAYKPNDGANNDTDPNNPLIMRPYKYSTSNATADDWYKTGLNNAFALVKVTISPTLISDDQTGENSPRRIDMSVETPGSANVSNRTCYLFTGAVKE